MAAADNWGWRARIGIFIVGSEPVPEAEWWAMTPPGVSVHAARVSASAPWARWDASREAVTLESDLERGALHFAGMKLSAVVIGHTSSSIAGGDDWDDAVCRRLAEVLPSRTAVTTNGLDCQAALAACKVRRPFLVFPPWFVDGMLDRGVDYFARAGLEPAGRTRIVPGHNWRNVPPQDLYSKLMHFEQDVEALYRQVRTECVAGADGVLFVGTGLRCVAVLEDLERDLQCPVLSANQASLWHCLKLSGVRVQISGYGSLLRL